MNCYHASLIHVPLLADLALRFWQNFKQSRLLWRAAPVWLLDFPPFSKLHRLSGQRCCEASPYRLLALSDVQSHSNCGDGSSFEARASWYQCLPPVRRKTPEWIRILPNGIWRSFLDQYEDFFNENHCCWRLLYMTHNQWRTTCRYFMCVCSSFVTLLFCTILHSTLQPEKHEFSIKVCNGACLEPSVQYMYITDSIMSQRWVCVYS